MTPAVAFALFFLSGACGLLYQLVWTRLAFSHFGVLMPVLSVVVSSFMLGLGLGSLLSGPILEAWARRTRRSVLWVYAAAEAGIALGAFVVPVAFRVGDRALLAGGDLDSASYLVSSACTIALSLLPFCVCMGLTLPIGMAALRERAASSRTGFSLLYFANVLGAMTGALLTSGVLVEVFGFAHTLRLAATANALLATVSAVLAWKAGPLPGGSDARPAGEPSAHPPARPVPAGVRWSLATLFTTAFVAVGFEIVWTRTLTPVLGTTIYAFALVVAVYLLATWLGTWTYRRDLARGELLSYERLCGVLVISAFVPAIVNDPRVAPGSIAALGSIAPTCALLGYLTPRLIDEYSGGIPGRAGFAYAVNVVGSILGPLAASYALLPTLGARGSTVALALPFAGLFVARGRSAGVRSIAVVMSLTLVLSGYTLRVASSQDEKCVAEAGGREVRRDYAATVASCGAGMLKRLFVNGIGITRLTPITKAMAHIPIVAHRGPVRSTLMICFGMGTTYRSLLSWPVQTVAVELVPSVRDAFGYYHADAAQALANPRGRVVIDDGRRYLQRGVEQFDIITLDPPPPVEAAGSSLLYSTEFYGLAKRRLAKDGILAQWWPTGELKILQAVARSLTLSFPYVRVFKGNGGAGFHFFASSTPIDIPEVAEFVERLPKAAQDDIREWAPNGDLEAGVGAMIARELPLEAVLSDDSSLVVTDDHPFNEYYFLRRLADTRDHTLKFVY